MRDDPEGLLRTLVLTWWARIGATDLGGVIKLMVAESGNFPDVAAYFHREVVQRGRALLRHALELGIERGVFRPVDVNMQVRVLWAPCDGPPSGASPSASCDTRICRGAYARLFRRDLDRDPRESRR